jgi:hypothetical protein
VARTADEMIRTAEKMLGEARGHAALERLGDLEAARKLADDAYVETVRELHRGGMSWTDVGQLLGMTRQAAWERFRESGSPSPNQEDRRRREGRKRTAQMVGTGWEGTPWTALGGGS